MLNATILARGGIGAVSMFKAVYVDKRELKCACVGGSSNVPLGFVSLTENLMIVAIGAVDAGRTRKRLGPRLAVLPRITMKAARGGQARDAHPVSAD